MRQEYCRVLASGRLNSGQALLELDCTPLGQPARAGQFLMVRSSTDTADALRHPLFFSRGGKTAQILFPVESGWQTQLASLQPEEFIDVLGPLGRPFELRPGASRLLILSLVEPLAPALAAAIWGHRQGAAVSMLLTEDDAIGLLPDDVECRVVSEEPLHDLGEELRWADQLLAVTRPDKLPAIENAIRAARIRLVTGFAGILLPSDFACGVGACGSCALGHGRSHLRSCADGPIFDFTQLL